MTHDFNEDFKFSSSPEADALVRRACYRLIADCSSVTRATPAEDRRGVDYWVITPTGRHGLDLKLRRKDYGATRGGSIDCVIELEGHGTTGWLLKGGGAGLVLFACIDTRRIALFDKRELQTAILLNLSRWIAAGRAREIDTDSQRNGRTWKNRAVIVSGDLLTAAIDRLDGGDWVEAANDWAAP